MGLKTGETVGPYRIMEQLGSGGMATVFKAYHPSLDRYVAIKVLHPAFKEDPQFFERFKREARIVAKLEHPHIIPVHDFNEHQGEPYLVMRYVEGDTLKPALKNDDQIAHQEILRIMRPVCQALEYAHRQGVVHRDIKPSNIMLTGDGTVFVTDFGLARMVEAGESTLSHDVLVGTPQYISPEQAQGLADLDGRTDIYSLGVVLYEMLTGRVPFNADTPFATVHDHIYTPLPLPSDINPKIDPAIERLLLKTLAKDRDDRFQTAGDLLTALKTTLDRRSTIAVPVTSPKKSSATPWWIWAGGAALIICMAGTMLAGAVWLRSRRTPPPANAQSSIQASSDTLPEPSPLPQDSAATDSQPLPAPPADGPVQAPEGNRPAPPANQPPPPPPAGGPPSSPADRSPPANQPPPPPAGNSRAEALTRQATEALRSQDPAGAMALYEQAIAVDPKFLPAYVGLSIAQRHDGNPEEALATMEQAVANNPADAVAWSRLGETQLFAEKNFEAALASFQEAIRLQPDLDIPYAGQAIALTALGQMDEAKQSIDTAFSLNSNSPEAHLANAYYLKEQGNRLAALRALRPLTQNPGLPPLIREHVRQLQTQLDQ